MTGIVCTGFPLIIATVLVSVFPKRSCNCQRGFPCHPSNGASLRLPRAIFFPKSDWNRLWWLGISFLKHRVYNCCNTQIISWNHLNQEHVYFFHEAPFGRTWWDGRKDAINYIGLHKDTPSPSIVWNRASLSLPQKSILISSVLYKV